MLIVVVALMIATLGYLYVSGQGPSLLHQQSDPAYFAGRSGIEYSTRQYFNGSACSSLNNAGVAVGSANSTFSLTPTLYAPLSLTATNAALTAASASIPVVNTAGYAPHGRVLVDAELINYSGNTATSFTGLTRGAGGTTAAAHASGAAVSQNVCFVKSTGNTGNATRVVEAALGAGTTASPGALGTMGADAMMVYAKGTALTGAGFDRNVYYRLWDGTANNWGAEQTSTQQVSANSSPAYFTLQFARTRNEAVMLVLDGNLNLYVHVWNGASWSNPRGAGVALATASTALARTAQVAYEYATDRALIVYQNNASNALYATWNGAALTLAGNIVTPYPVSGSNGAQCGANLATNAIPVVIWFRLAPRNVAGSNDILMMSMDCKQDVYGMHWTGAAWSDMGTAARWDTTISAGTNNEAIDVAWQSDGTRAVFVYGDAANLSIRWRTWTAATSTLGALVAATALTNPGGYTAQRFEWVRLYPGPGNAMLLVLQTANAATNPSLITTTWASGTATFNTAAPPVTGHDNGNAAATGVENALSRGFDFVWEQRPASSGSGWLLWGSHTATAGIHTRYFTAPAAWGAVAAVRDRTLLVQAGAMSPSGRFVSGIYQASASANDDTESLTTTGGGTVWPNAATTIWVGPTTYQQGERVFVATREGPRINTGATGTSVVSILQSEEP